MNVQDLRASVIRTAVPFLVAWLSTWLPRELGITDEQLTAGVALIVGGAWWLIARVLEVYVAPVIGRVMLGLGFYGAPTYGRHEAGRPDGGYVRPTVLLAAGAVAALVVTVVAVGAAQADQRPHRARGLVHVGVSYLSVCNGIVGVWFGVERRVGDHWQHVQDDGAGVVVEVRYVGNGAAPGGQWQPVTVTQQSDNYRGFPSSRPTYDAVRVRHRGVASTAVAAANARRCAA